jgi:cytochrome c-type biogenesis protein CcmH
MTWVLAGGLAILAFLAAAFVLKAPRKGWEAIVAALLLGLAGYALQGSPGIPAAPKAAVQKVEGNAAALVEARRMLNGKVGPAGDNFLVIGDALARNGQYADAAGVMLGAVEKDPKNGEAWLAIANALAGHADGQLTPASLFAFRRAADADPTHPGPPFFLGLSLAQSGRLVEARDLWGDLLTRTPPDAPWRADLEQRLQQLDAIIARQQAAAGNP